MAVHKIKNSTTSTVVAQQAHDTWIVTATAKVETMTTGINADGPAKGREIIVEGLVSGANYGISFGDMFRKGGGLIEIASNGTVSSADTAILSRGNDQDVVNKGTISSDLDGIVSMGNRFDLVNDGKFTVANTAVYIEEGSARIVNNGKMFGESGVYAVSDAGTGKIVVINNGLMDTTKSAIDLQNDGNHLIVNRGVIKADVSSGGGDDRFVNDGGKVAGRVNLGDGNDTYVIDRTTIEVDESSYDGKDTVKASVDYTIGGGIEKLILTGKANIDGIGNSDNNRVSGNSGNNRIDGGGGDDLLKGAGGRDVFVFEYHGGSDEILDFKSGQDRIDMRGWADYGFENFADVKAGAVKMGHDLLITNGGSDDLLIHDFAKADLDKADFIF
jgi:Ca2+-binding RTX toxin-like protein